MESTVLAITVFCLCGVFDLTQTRFANSVVPLLMGNKLEKARWCPFREGLVVRVALLAKFAQVQHPANIKAAQYRVQIITKRKHALVNQHYNAQLLSKLIYKCDYFQLFRTIFYYDYQGVLPVMRAADECVDGSHVSVWVLQAHIQVFRVAPFISSHSPPRKQGVSMTRGRKAMTTTSRPPIHPSCRHRHLLPHYKLPPAGLTKWLVGD